MGLVLPEYLTKWTTEKVKQEGVNVITNAFVKDVSMDGDKVKVTTHDHREVSNLITFNSSSWSANSNER